MHSVAQALQEVLRHASPLSPLRASFSDALGLILAEDVASDTDSPPHDKSMVDGYALRRQELTDDQPTLLNVLEEVTAGRTPTLAVTPGAATRIMTGAPIPDGADAVVMVEETTLLENDKPDGAAPQVRIDAGARIPDAGNILRQGVSMRAGQMVLRAGKRIGPVEIGLLAEVGRRDVYALARPTVAVIATGDELVAPGEPLTAGMIRNSNGPMLDSLATRAGAVAVGAVVARDNVESLEAAIEAGLQHDMLLLSGGVSAGVLDLAPQVLSQCGVRQVFHKVRVKPGKPLWFGCKTHGDRRHDTLVFGLPGNPVSSLVGFLLFAAPALRRLAGNAKVMSVEDELDSFLDFHRFRRASLVAGFQHRGERPTFFPAVTTQRHDGMLAAKPLDWRGSADLCTLTEADSLICFPAGTAAYEVGDEVRVLRI